MMTSLWFFVFCLSMFWTGVSALAVAIFSLPSEIIPAVFVLSSLVSLIVLALCRVSGSVNND